MRVDLLLLLTSAGVRACGLGLIASASLALFRVRSSSARHAIWTAALAGMLAQIPLTLVAPSIPMEALPAPATSAPPRAAADLTPAGQASAPASRQSAGHSGSGSRRTSSGAIVIGAYLAIAAFLLARIAAGLWGLGRILRKAASVPQLGPGTVESDLLSSPGSAGWLHPRILLPRTWRDWDSSKLQAVLAHERAHVQRRDWLIRIASQVNVCIFWFHPFAWWLERELARLAEEACDDAALAEVKDGEAYAAALVEIAGEAAAAGRLEWRLVFMAKSSHVMRRVDRILNRGRHPIPKPLGRLAWAMLVVGCLPVIYFFAAVELVPAAQVAPVPRPPAPAVTICILVDNSGSMRDNQQAAQNVALALVKAAQPGDEVCILHFSDEVFNGLAGGKDFTSDLKAMQEGLARIDSRGGKAMRDAVRVSIEKLATVARHRRRAVVLITEGSDSSSTATESELLDIVRNSGVPVFAVGLLSEEQGRAAGARAALGQLAEVSGALAFFPRHTENMDRISTQLANAVRKQ